MKARQPNKSPSDNFFDIINAISLNASGKSLLETLQLIEMTSACTTTTGNILLQIRARVVENHQHRKLPTSVAICETLPKKVKTGRQIVYLYLKFLGKLVDKNKLPSKPILIIV